MGDVVLFRAKFKQNYNMFGYGVDGIIVVCIVKRFNGVNSIIIDYNKVFLANNAQIISKSRVSDSSLRPRDLPLPQVFVKHPSWGNFSA